MTVNWQYDERNCNLGQHFEVDWECDDGRSGTKSPIDCSANSTVLSDVSVTGSCTVKVAIVNCAGRTAVSAAANIDRESECC